MIKSQTSREINLEMTYEKTYFYGIGLVSLMGLTYWTTWIGLFFSVRPGYVPAAITLILFVVFNLRFNTCIILRHRISFIIVPILTIFVTGFFASSVFDGSYDGLAYHQGATLAIMSGWRPLLDPLLGSTIWAQHYAKASWVVGATLGNIFQTVEAGKAQNLIFMFAAAALSFSAAGFFLRRWKVLLLFTIVVVLNPPSVYQAITAMNDGLVGSQLTCLVALGIIAVKTRIKSAAVSLALLIPYTVNLKFTGLIYVTFLVLGFFLFLYLIKQTQLAKTLLPFLLGGLISGVLVIGADPYITNTVTYRHPFYPLAGEGKVEIIAQNIPLSIKDQGYFYRLIIGYYGTPQAYLKSKRDLISLVPSPGSLAEFTDPAIRIGGFGPLFGIISLVLLLGAITLRNVSAQQRRILLSAALLLVSGLINPQAWWARYVPQVWLAASLVALVLVVASPPQKFTRLIGVCALWIMLLNAVAISTVAAASAYTRDNVWRANLNRLRDISDTKPLLIDFTSQLATKARLDAYKIHYIPLSSLKGCKHVVPLIEPPKSYLSDGAICEY